MRKVKVQIGELKQGDRYRYTHSHPRSRESVVLSEEGIRTWLDSHGGMGSIPVVSCQGARRPAVILHNRPDTVVIVERPNPTYGDLVPGDRFTFVGSPTVFRKLSVGHANPQDVGELR